MLSDAAFEVVGDPYVEDAGRACQDIDVVDHDALDFATCEEALSFRAQRDRSLLSFRAQRDRSPSCHSERSEESWLGLNPAETNETRRKTP